MPNRLTPRLQILKPIRFTNTNRIEERFTEIATQLFEWSDRHLEKVWPPYL
jgi:hypothetical protein